MACKSNIMTYRSKLSLDTLYRFFGEITGLGSKSFPDFFPKRLEISPLPAKMKGTLGLYSVRLSDRPSDRPSVSQQYQFSGFFP